MTEFTTISRHHLARLAATGFYFCKDCGKTDIRPGIESHGFKACPECASINISWCPPVFSQELTPTNQERN
jgi:phage FluMu protein Com